MSELRCESACGSDTFCPMPSFNVPMAEWNAFWAKHPARAGIRPLTVEAGMRLGGVVEDVTGADEEPPFTLVQP